MESLIHSAVGSSLPLLFSPPRKYRLWCFPFCASLLRFGSLLCHACCMLYVAYTCVCMYVLGCAYTILVNHEISSGLPFSGVTRKSPCIAWRHDGDLIDGLMLHVWSMYSVGIVDDFPAPSSHMPCSQRQPTRDETRQAAWPSHTRPYKAIQEGRMTPRGVDPGITSGWAPTCQTSAVHWGVSSVALGH
jgi:hypothetical protein